MTSSLGGSGRRCRGLTDIVPQYDDSQSDKISNGSSEGDQRTSINGIKIQHLTSSCAVGHSRFPKLEECAHFHYEHVELNSLQVSLYEEEDLKSLSSLECNENSENKWLTVKVSSQGQSWLLRRTYENFRMLDQQLHQCIYDRKFSTLPELPPLENLPEKQDPQTYIKCHLSRYCERFSDIAGNLINCGPVLSWLQLDNRGRRILVTDGDSCPINTPGVAAAYAVKKYTAVAADEISFDVGDMISVIDMPPPEDSIWWRGKRGFMVGFFPSYCVAVITDKVPRNLQLNQPSTIIEPSKPVLRKHGKLIAFFRAFILSRPSKRHLKQSGILKERVFGCDLGEHLLNSGRDVPMVLKCCSEFIEQHGIVDGIYRLSGATSNIQKLRTTFDEDRIPALYNDDSILQDIHSVASLLKMYFRELPNPLCTYQLYKNFVHAVQNADPTERVAMMRDVVQKLPPPHFRTLEFLMRHLSRVAEHGTRTGMTARNIAIVWAPNLLRCKELEFGGVAALQGVGVQAVVTEFLISNVDLVFSNDHHSFHGTAKRVRPKSLSLGTPTKLLSLEEAQSKKLGLESSHDNYIEVGGGPACLPKIYHTVIELPHRKRVPLKRSPLGWKSFFSRSSSGSTGLRKSSSTNSGKRKTSTSTEISYKLPESSKKPEPDVKSRLRSVKSAESLISGAGNSASVRNSVCLEYLSPPSPKLSGTAGHSRSVSHDSYFDHLAESTPIHSTIRQDEEGLSDLQVNFDLDESEMKIFSEESSQLFSNTSSSEHVQSNLKKIPILASAENTIIVDPSPKKHKTSDSSSCSSATLSDDMTAVSNKRSRLEERLLNEDFAYIDSQCDRLVVEVDVHHRESSHLSSPMTDTAYSENDTILSGCTMSDSMTTTNNVMYTPLSECSYTTSSMYEPSYQPLSSSMSSSHLPRSSTESIRTSELKKYENVPRNRFSYQGDLRPGITMRNRLSLQTLNSHTVHDCHRDSVSSNSVCENRLNGEVTKYDVSCSKTQLLNEKLPDKCDDAFVKWHQKSVCGNETADENNFGDEPSTLSNDRLQWNSNDDGAHCILSNSSSASTESEQNSRYENVQKLELILNDKEMFSEPSKFSSPANESPYELVTMVGNRMTSVSADENTEFLKNNKTPTESNYEEVRPVSPNQLHHPLKTTIPTICAAGYGNYEEMSSEYAENEIYNFEGSLARSEKKSNYEEISLLDDISDLRAFSSSNESLESSVDEAMVENNLYESLVAEDSSPDPGSNLSSRTADNGIAFTSRRSEDIPLYKNIIVTTDVSNKESDETLLTETNPLLISDTQSSYSDTEPPQFCKSPTKNVQSAEQMSPSGVNSRNFVEKISRKDDQLQDVNQPLTLSVAAEEMIISNCDTQPNDIKSPHSDRIVEKNDQNMPDLSSSGYAKSVQDLVSKFEWSAENDPLKKDPPIYRSKTTSQMQTTMDKTEYFSLPPVLVKRLSEDSFCNAIEMAGDDKEDESVRRDRIEKYKEERRLALRQKYQVDDSLNDKKDEEMIRRFKQKIMKNEKIDSKNRIEFDSSPNDDVVLKNEHLLAKENYDKLPTSVTTISILYTSRKKRDSVEDDSPRLKSAEEKRNESQSPGAHGALSKCPEPQISCEINRTCLKNNGNADSSMSKSFSSVAEQSRDWPLKSADGKRPFTSSLERKMKSFVREESLVAKRVNQLSEASELSETSHSKRNGETGSMRQRAHSTSGPIAPYCIRDIAAIFENKDNNK